MPRVWKLRKESGTTWSRTLGWPFTEQSTRESVASLPVAYYDQLLLRNGLQTIPK